MAISSNNLRVSRKNAAILLAAQPRYRLVSAKDLFRQPTVGEYGLSAGASHGRTSRLHQRRRRRRPAPMTSTSCSSTGPRARSRTRGCASCSCAWRSGRGSSIAGRCCRRRRAGLPHNHPGGFYHGDSAGHLDADAALCRGGARAGARGDRQAERSRSRSTASPISSSRAAPASSPPASTRSSPAELGLDDMSSGPWSASWAATPPSRRCAPAYHIVRSEPEARVLAVTVELCSPASPARRRTLEQLLAMLQFGDGAAAALVTRRAGRLRDEPPLLAPSSRIRPS